jgi:hypothetical protein
MTAAVFEARLCPTWLNEIKKTKLYTYTSPAAGINFLLWLVFQRLCFCSGAFPKPRPVPRNEALNEDKTLNQLVTAPLQKHFVGNVGTYDVQGF